MQVRARSDASIISLLSLFFVTLIKATFIHRIVFNVYNKYVNVLNCYEFNNSFINNTVFFLLVRNSPSHLYIIKKCIRGLRLIQCSKCNRFLFSCDNIEISQERLMFSSKS